LVEFGVPDGPVRPASADPIDPEIARRALEEVLSSQLDTHHAELLLAWLRAWQHHWPTSFAHAFGELGTAAVDRLSSRVTDAGRYLKLRRIAIDNLAPRL
jgi:hypothetical protein